MATWTSDGGAGRIGRRTLLGAAAGLAAGARTASAQGGTPALSGRPVPISVIDVGGALTLTQKCFDAYAAKQADRVSRFVTTRAPAPELAGKIRAMQRANRIDIDFVLTGTDGLAAGLELDLWEEVGRFGDPGLSDDLYEGTQRALHGFARGYGMLLSFSQQGPFIQYAPDRVVEPPRTLAGLLDWARAHPNRLIYPRPANSGVGRCFLMGLPYLLGDRDPKDPQNGWDKTWAYLKELDRHIEYYPSGTAAMIREFSQGSRELILSTMGWDINPRVMGIVPKEAAIGVIEGVHLVSDGHFVTIPKGLPPDRLAAAVDVMKFLLTPEQQAVTYDEGYLYPGPARRGVTLDMAPPESQRVIKEFGRPVYDTIIKERPVETPLEPKQMVVAFRLWDERIGGQRTR